MKHIFFKSIGQSFSVSLQAVTKRYLAGQKIFSLHALTFVVRHFMECLRDMWKCAFKRRIKTADFLLT